MIRSYWVRKRHLVPDDGEVLPAVLARMDDDIWVHVSLFGDEAGDVGGGPNQEGAL